MEFSVFRSGHFKTFDQKLLFYRYLPKPQAEATLVIVHGHGEHSGRYEKFASELKSLPVSIAVFDLRGNGRSEGEEVYVDSLADYLKDLSVFLNFIHQSLDNSGPMILLGHSLGGLISLQWTLQNPGSIKGLVLSSPCLGLNIPPLLAGINKVINYFNPKFLYQSPVYPPHLTHSLDEQKMYRTDPLIKRKISARLAHEMREGGEQIKSMKEIVFPIPVAVLTGDMEKVVDPSAARVFYAKLQAPWKDFRLFHGFYHEIFNELGQEKAFEALRQILLKMLG
ncbi:MAG: alpha/beta hydrolase [Candidatus Omnitrophica bacterium]|nr:alpha/beta hydrolase [Candidatus Omnitrophota bacterium]